jgi:membrane protein insertase Oxa1/YidC/SpoIIIJ
VFLKFPAGLVLYWLTNNVVGIVQQEVYKKIRGEQPAIAAQGGKSKQGRKPKKG